MATFSVAPPRCLPQPGKLQVYQQQVSINLAIENIVLGCQQLQTLNIIPRGFLVHYVNMAEELRALINRRIMDDMMHIENRDAKRLQDERLKWEARPYPRVPKPFRIITPTQGGKPKKAR